MPCQKRKKKNHKKPKTYFKLEEKTKYKDTRKRSKNDNKGYTE